MLRPCVKTSIQSHWASRVRCSRMSHNSSSVVWLLSVQKMRLIASSHTAKFVMFLFLWTYANTTFALKNFISRFKTTRITGLGRRRWKNLCRICSAVLTECRSVTDRQKDILQQHSLRYAYAVRCKNCKLLWRTYKTVCCRLYNCVLVIIGPQNFKNFDNPAPST